MVRTGETGGGHSDFESGAGRRAGGRLQDAAGKTARPAARSPFLFSGPCGSRREPAAPHEQHACRGETPLPAGKSGLLRKTEQNSLCADRPPQRGRPAGKPRLRVPPKGRVPRSPKPAESAGRGRRTPPQKGPQRMPNSARPLAMVWVNSVSGSTPRRAASVAATWVSREESLRLPR